MDGPRLASLAIDTMADQLSHMAARHGLPLDDIPGIMVHGGNGRLPALLARRLHLPEDRVLSQTAATGNLGSASLPAAWAAHRDRIGDPVLWVAVGAGLTSAVALTGMRRRVSDPCLLDL
jgi:3-oxoacyl-[acyl-carrier-protein] synthase-3